MRASQQLKYAIYGIFDLAYHGADGPMPIQEIGSRQGIPPRYLEHIFQRMRKADLIVSKRGPGGGYRLKRPAAEIRLSEVVRAVQGDVLARPADSASAGPDAPVFVWEKLEAGIEQALSAWTVGDLCRIAASHGIERRDAKAGAYQI